MDILTVVFPTLKQSKAVPIGTEELSRRYAAGLDLWTANPLVGQDLLDRRRLGEGRSENWKARPSVDEKLWNELRQLLIDELGESDV